MLQFFRTGPVFTAIHNGHSFIIRAVVNGIELQVHNASTRKTKTTTYASVAEATAAANREAGMLDGNVIIESEENDA